MVDVVDVEGVEMIMMHPERKWEENGGGKERWIVVEGEGRNLN